MDLQRILASECGMGGEHMDQVATQTTRPRPKKEPKQAKAKGKGKQHEEQPTFGPPSIPPPLQMDTSWMNAPHVPAPAAPSVVAPPSKDTKEDKNMKSLVAALRKHKDDLPADVQALMTEVQLRDGQNERKQLHAAVTQHGKAKKEIQEAQQARHLMHSAWRNFLSQSVEQWEKYTSQFIEQEKVLTERVKAAHENLAIAKANLTNCKVAVGAPEPKDDASATSEVEDMDTKDPEVSAGKRIVESFQCLSNSLQDLHAQAVQAVQQEAELQDHLRKRPRTTPPGGATDPAANPPANASFGGAE